MVDFSVKTTDIGKPNVSFRQRQGVVDKSKAMGISADYDFIAQTGAEAVETFQEYDKAKVLKETAETVGDVIREQQDRSIEGVQGLQEQEAQLQDNLTSTQQGAGYDGTYPTMLNQKLQDDSQGITNDLAETTDKLTRAREQGIMGKDELKERLAKITREAIARNPAYAAEITAHISAVADQHNIVGRIEKDANLIKEMNKSAEADEKRTLDLAVKLNIPIYADEYKDGSGQGFNLAAIQEAITKKMGQNEINAAYDQSVKTGEAIGKVNAQKAIDAGYHLDLTDARIADSRAKMDSILLDQTKSPTEKIIAMETILSDQERDMRRFYQIHRIPTDNYEIKTSLDMFTAEQNRLKVLYEKVASGKLDKEQVENWISTYEANAKMRVYKRHPDLAETQVILDAVEPISARLGIGLVNKMEQKITKMFTDSEASITDPVEVPRQDADRAPVKELGCSYQQQGLKGCLNSAIQGGEQEKQIFENNLNKELAFIELPDTENGKTTLRDTMKLMADPRTNQLINSFSGETISRLNQAFDMQMGMIQNAYQEFITANPDAELAYQPNSGTMYITNNKPEYSAFVKGDLRSINDAIKAYINISGEPIPTAIESFDNKLRATPEKK